MKTGARFLSILLATLMIAGAVFTVGAADFSDVPDNYTYRDAIDVLSRLGVIGGYGDGTYKPENNVERDEMAKLVYVLQTTFTDAGEGSSVFTDTEGNWANGYISYCVSMGIIGGHGDGTFRPDEYVTYDQALKMVCAALGYTDFDSAKWPTDVRLVGIKQLKLNKGLPSTLNGNDYMTRGQVAQLFYNALFVAMKETTSVPGPFGAVEISMQLARDVWNFNSYTGTIVATDNLALTGSPTGSASKVVIADLVNDQTGIANTALDGEYTFADLGFAEYADEADTLIGRKVRIFEYEDALMANSAVIYGDIYYDVELSIVKSGKADDLTKIAVGGTNYAIADILYYVDETTGELVKDTTTTTIAATDAAYGKFPLNASGAYIDGAAVPSVLANIYSNSIANTKATGNVAIDSEGDGKYDYLITYVKTPYVLDNIASNEYTFSTLLTDGGVATQLKVKSADLVSDVDLAKGDVVVMYTFAGKTYVDTVVKPVTTYITKSINGTIALNGEEEDFWFHAGANTAFVGIYDDVASVSGVGKTATEREYYIYNNRIIATKAIAGPAPAEIAMTNTAVMLGTEGVTDWEYNPFDNKYYQFWPVILFEDGMEKKANIKSLNGYDSTDNGFEDEYNKFLMFIDKSNVMKYVNEYVAYTVDKDGYYHIYTYDYIYELIPNTDADKEIFLSADDGKYTVDFLEDVNLFRVYDADNTVDSYMFDVDDSAIMYYFNDEGKLDYITGSDIVEFGKSIDGVEIPYAMQLKVNKDSMVYTLSSVMFTERASGINDVPSMAKQFDKHMFFHGENTGKRVGEDGYTVHYSYIYYTIMGGNSYVQEASRLSIDEGAVPMKPSNIAVYKDDGTIERIKPSKNFENPDQSPYLFFATIEHIEQSSGVIFTDINPDGISIADAMFIAFNFSTNSAQPGSKATVDLATMKSAFDAAQKDKVPFSIIYAYDPDTKQVVYVIYGREEEKDYNSMDEVYTNATT